MWLRPDLGEQVAVVGDRDRLKQALLNLVANALQHTPPGGSVSVALARDGPAVTLRVRDTGPGIAPEDLPHIFERFYRGDRAHRSTGAGLGLAIVRWVAETHGGQAEVASCLGQGATLTIRLPVEPGGACQPRMADATTSPPN